MASHWTTGKTTSLTGISTGGWFGEGSLLKNETRRYDVMALRETRVAFMSRSTFLWLLDHSIPFNRHIIAQLNERLGQFVGMIENERMLDTDARIARGLAALFNPVLYPGTNRLLQISQEELGYLAGVSRQRANQALSTRRRRAGTQRVWRNQYPRPRRAALLPRLTDQDRTATDRRTGAPGQGAGAEKPKHLATGNATVLQT